MVASDEATYLKETVGAALAQGVAATLAANANDPVEFLGKWLRTYVNNVKVKADFAVEVTTADEAEASLEEDRKAAAAKAEQLAAAEQEALENVLKVDGYPQDIWQEAADTIIRHTEVASAYVAVVTPAEEGDYKFEGEEEAGDDGEAAGEPETDDELEDNPPAPPPGEDGEPEAEAEPADEEQTAPKEDVDPETVCKRTWDYSKHHLEYVANAPGTKKRSLGLLQRPPPPPEDADDDFKQPPTPITLRLLDENLPSLYVPSTLDEVRVKYFNDFPSIGALYAAAAVQGTGRYSTVITADTLVPDGSGGEITVKDRDFIWAVSQKVAKRLEAFASERIAARSTSTAADEVKEFKEKLLALRAPQAPEGADAAEGDAAAPAEGGDAAEAEAEPEEEPAGDEEEAAEGEAPVDPAVKSEKLTKKAAKLSKQLEKLEKQQASADDLHKRESECMIAVKSALAEKKDAAIKELKAHAVSPPATMHVLTAVMRLIQHGEEPFTWNNLLPYVNDELFSKLGDYDAESERDMALWKRIRAAYKAVGKSNADKLWSYETPCTSIGSYLMIFVKQVRRLAKATAAAKKVAADCDAVKSKQASTSAALEAATKAQEEAAAAAAEPATAEGGADDAYEEEAAA